MQIPLTVIVLNNGVLGYQRDAEMLKFGAYTTACHFAPVDHAAIARACGCQGIRVEEANAILPTLKAALHSGKPSLIEVMTDPDAHPPLSRTTGRSIAPIAQEPLS
jgi:acetolactate synthase-1/2/3 large subunit